MVTWENYEEYMLLDADGELNDEQMKALHEFIGLHPEIKKEYDLLKATVLQPDNSIVYEQKQELIKKSNVRKLNYTWWLYGAAASIILMVAFLSINHKDRNIQTAKNEIDKIPVKMEKPVMPSKDLHSPVKPVTIETALKKDELENISGRKAIARSKPIPMQRESIDTRKEVPEELPIIETPVYEVAIETPVFGKYQLDTPLKVINHAADDNNKFLALLSKEKPAGVTDFSNTMSRKLDRAREIAQAIKETDLSIMLGNKEVLTIKF